MWVCKSCMMENDDSDLNCYMCGTKRPHTPPVRKPPVRVQESVSAEQKVVLPDLQVTPVQPKTEPVAQEPASVVQPPVAEQDETPKQTEEPLRSALLSDFVEAIRPTEPFVPSAEPVFPKQESEGEKKAQEENPFASIFNVSTPPLQSETPPVRPQSAHMQEKTQEKLTDDFHTVFNDFLNALQQQEAQQAQAARPFAQTDTVYPDPYSQPQSPRAEEPQPAKRREKKKYDVQTVGGGVFSFMRACFVVVMFVWVISFVLFVIARVTDADAAYISYMADELAYLFERGISELKLSALAEYFVSLIGSL